MVEDVTEAIFDARLFWGRRKDEVTQNDWWDQKSLIPFKTPANIFISGPSQSGKTFLTAKIINNAKGMFEDYPNKIVYAYSEKQPLFGTLKAFNKNLIFYQGIPSQSDLEEWSVERKHVLLILDDLMPGVCNSADSLNLFTIKAHHLRISVIFIAQNLYPPGRYSRTISLNIHYFLLFRNRRDTRQVETLARQIFDKDKKAFMSVYQSSTSGLFKYLLIDIHPRSEPDIFRVRTHILPGEDTHIYQFGEKQW